MQILLHATGWRVEYRKHRGLFSNIVGADHYVGDLTRLEISDGRRISIKQPWMRVGEGAAALVAGAKLRGGARERNRRSLPYRGPGVSLTRFWVRSDQRRTRDPPGSRSGQGDAWSGARDGGGNSGRRGFAGAHTFRRRRGRSWTITEQGVCE